MTAYFDFGISSYQFFCILILLFSFICTHHYILGTFLYCIVNNIESRIVFPIFWSYSNYIHAYTNFYFIVTDKNKCYILEPYGTHKFYSCKCIWCTQQVVLKLLLFSVGFSKQMRYCWDVFLWLYLGINIFSDICILIHKFHCYAGKWRW